MLFCFARLHRASGAQGLGPGAGARPVGLRSEGISPSVGDLCQNYFHGKSGSREGRECVQLKIDALFSFLVLLFFLFFFFLCFFFFFFFCTFIAQRA